jgi:hypothetical protein
MGPTTAEACVFAPGAGTGHLVRAVALVRELEAAGYRVRAFASPTTRWGLLEAARCGVRPIEDAGRALRRGGDLLVVDTFPCGLDGSITPAVTARFAKASLVARYARTTDWQEAAERYHEVLDPYPEGRSEWPERPAHPNVRSIGWVLHPEPLTIRREPKLLTVLDPGSRLDTERREAVVRTAKEAGYRVQMLADHTRRFSADRVLTIGAGYQSVYELVASGVDFRAVPLSRRHDDQVRRVELLRRGMAGTEELARWLAGAAPSTKARAA